VRGPRRQRYRLSPASRAADADAQRRHQTDEALLVHIRAVHAETRGAYGWPRLWRELGQRGVRVGKQRVQRLLQKHGIRARGRRHFRVATTDSRHDLPIAPNRLERNFSPLRPDTAWSGDITYIATEEGWLFLAVVIDLFSQRVVGWSLQRTWSAADNRCTGDGLATAAAVEGRVTISQRSRHSVCQPRFRRWRWTSLLVGPGSQMFNLFSERTSGR